MKIIRNVVFISLNLLVCISAQAQWGLGFQASAMAWSQNHGYTEDGRPAGFDTPHGGSGIGLQAVYLVKPRARVYIGLDLIGTPTRMSNSPLIYSGDIKSGELSVNNSGSLLRGEYQYAFTHNFTEKGFTFYGEGGVSMNTYHYEVKYDETIVPQGGPSTVSTISERRTYSGGSLNLGLGLEYNFNYHTHICFDVRVSPGDRTNFASVLLNSGDFLPENFNPGYVTASIGMRFMLKQSHHEDKK